MMNLLSNLWRYDPIITPVEMLAAAAVAVVIVAIMYWRNGGL